MISRLNWRIIELIFKRTFRVFIAIPGVIGLLLVLNTQTGFAQSNMQGDGGRLVDGGQLFEELEQSEILLEDIENSLEYPGVPPRRIIQTSGDSLPPIRIMPLGDSITKGTGTCQEGDPPDPPNELYLNCTGYRDFLWYSLVDNGYTVDFVGSQGSQFQDDYLNPYHDNDHEGHGGRTADWIRDRVYGPSDHFLLDNPADIVLLHIGTNDINGLPLLSDPIDVVAEVSQILDKIDNYETSEGHEVLVILARIINRSDPLSDKGQQTTDFNLGLQSMAESRIAGGDNILVVDMEAALIYPDDLGDELHPNETGYSKMANEWFSALEQVIFNLRFSDRIVLPFIIKR
jgi:lysophospholipase L1-like esterase